MPIRRDEEYRNGQVVAADVWDTDTVPPQYRREENGVVVAQRNITADELAALTAVDPRTALRQAIAAAESPAELQALLLQAIDQGIV